MLRYKNNETSSPNFIKNQDLQQFCFRSLKGESVFRRETSREIEEAISTAKCVVVLWSQMSIKSDWVKEEATFGKKRKILIPAKTDLVKPPMGFGINHAADLTDWEAQKSHFGINGLVEAITSILGPSLLGNWLMQDHF